MRNSCKSVFPYTRIRTARMKLDKEAEEGKKKGVRMERSEAYIKEKRSPDGLTITRTYRPLGVATPRSS